MIKLLDEAINKVKILSDYEQERIALINDVLTFDRHFSQAGFHVLT